MDATGGGDHVCLGPDPATPILLIPVMLRYSVLVSLFQAWGSGAATWLRAAAHSVALCCMLHEGWPVMR